MDAPFITTTGDAKGKVELPASLFGQEGSLRVLQEVLIAYQANLRRGTSNTKTRAEVSGGGHKPWRQKGTGNARSGSNRSPLWRKGGIIFGPRPRSYRIDVNEYKRRLALVTALSEKAKGKELSILENFPENEGKTGVTVKFLAKAVPEGRILLVVEKKTDMLSRAVQNIKRISVTDARELNCWQLLASKQILLTQASLKALESRWPQG